MWSNTRTVCPHKHSMPTLVKTEILKWENCLSSGVGNWQERDRETETENILFFFFGSAVV
jgi:hypothetical protein